MTCKSVEPERLLIVDFRGDPEKHYKVKNHKYTYESSEVFPDGQGNDQYNAILLHVVWKCTICEKVVTQCIRVAAPRKCSDFIEIEDEETR